MHYVIENWLSSKNSCFIFYAFCYCFTAFFPYLQKGVVCKGMHLRRDSAPEVPLKRLWHTLRDMMYTITCQKPWLWDPWLDIYSFYLLRCTCIDLSYIPHVILFCQYLKLLLLFMIFGCLLGSSFVQSSAWEDPVLEWIW